MRAYADTSLLISLYGRDANTFAAISLIQTHHPTFLLTPFGDVEFTNAVELRLFQGQWTAPEARSVLEDFRSDFGAGIIQLEDLPPETWSLAMTLSRRHSAKLGTRTLDVLHVASALVLKPDAFLTFDERQRKLARAEGLRVLPAPSRKRQRRRPSSSRQPIVLFSQPSEFPNPSSADRPVPPALPHCDPAGSRRSIP